MRFELPHVISPMLVPFGGALVGGLPKVAVRTRAVAVGAAEVGVGILYVDGRRPQLGGAVVLEGAWRLQHVGHVARAFQSSVELVVPISHIENRNEEIHS